MLIDTDEKLVSSLLVLLDFRAFASATKYLPSCQDDLVLQLPSKVYLIMLYLSVYTLKADDNVSSAVFPRFSIFSSESNDRYSDLSLTRNHELSVSAGFV
jgi:hypothetical protein